MGMPTSRGRGHACKKEEEEPMSACLVRKEDGTRVGGRRRALHDS